MTDVSNMSILPLLRGSTPGGAGACNGAVYGACRTCGTIHSYHSRHEAFDPRSGARSPPPDDQRATGCRTRPTGTCLVGVAGGGFAGGQSDRTAAAGHDPL